MTALFVLSLWWTFWPPQDAPEHVEADALLVLGPHGARMADADKFMDVGLAETLVIATSGECEDEAAYRVVCFRPDPYTTQGEAIFLRDMAEEHDWDSAAVMTVDHHVTRSRLHMNRCFDGDLYMIGVEAEGLWGSWWRTYLYQNTGLAHALISPGCESEPPGWLEDLRERAKDIVRT
ncbi:hypothetical protein [Nesterenkonia populi]|uniref:hypothetical protein n=1 Tax=Nesterenkonia populi TaxID=1591087 RepID=UPI0011BE128C|nr:hypothetical protein [Nesterenkonia populi]